MPDLAIYSDRIQSCKFVLQGSLSFSFEPHIMVCYNNWFGLICWGGGGVIIQDYQIFLLTTTESLNLHIKHAHANLKMRKFDESQLLALYVRTFIFGQFQNFFISKLAHVLEETIYLITLNVRIFCIYAPLPQSITPVMSGFKSCKNLARWFKICKICKILKAKFASC